jgi:hypothetical protein
MAYTKEGIMGQVWVAFGQGTGAMRVHQDAALALGDIYSRMITPDVIANWAKGAVQALERVRAVGRMAASKAAQRGATAISAADVTSSASTVHLASQTEWCPPQPPLTPGGQPAS